MSNPNPIYPLKDKLFPSLLFEDFPKLLYVGLLVLLNCFEFHASVVNALIIEPLLLKFDLSYCCTLVPPTVVIVLL